MNTNLKIKIVTIGVITSSIFLSSCVDNPVRKKLNNSNSSYYSGIRAFAVKLDGDKKAEAFYKNPKNHGRKYYYNTVQLQNKNRQFRENYLKNQKKRKKMIVRRRASTDEGVGSQLGKAVIYGLALGGLAVGLGIFKNTSGSSTNSVSPKPTNTSKKPKKKTSQAKQTKKKTSSANQKKKATAKGVKGIKVVGKQFGKFTLYRVTCNSGKSDGNFYQNSKGDWRKTSPINTSYGYTKRSINQIANTVCN